MAKYLTLKGLATVWSKIKYESSETQEIFNRYYGLIAAETNILSDGSIVITNSEATITVVKTENDDGTKVITETIVPISGSVNYVKTTTIRAGTDDTKTITEKYLEESK